MRLNGTITAISTLFASAALSFAPNRARHHSRSLSPLRLSTKSNVGKIDDGWAEWATANGITSPKLIVHEPLEEERGKGGVRAGESISALEVVARIPNALVLAAMTSPPRAVRAAAEAKNFSWALDLTAAAVASLHPSEEELAGDDAESVLAKQRWISGWENGGWATNGADLGECKWGSEGVTGTLMATGSDNDHNIYAKFRMPCHPTVHRAGLGLAMLTNSEEGDALDALMRRGRVYRSMRDALAPLVENPTERKGSINERRRWDVADTLSKVLSRATKIDLDGETGPEPTSVIVPLHERLGQCDDRGANVKLVAGDDEVMLVALRDIGAGEEITRDYVAAPRLDDDSTEGPLRLLLQFGLPPSAW